MSGTFMHNAYIKDGAKYRKTVDMDKRIKLLKDIKQFITGDRFLGNIYGNSILFVHSTHSTHYFFPNPNSLCNSISLENLLIISISSP